eukprot:5690872-Alexandrium_andersonii.AAC.1
MSASLVGSEMCIRDRPGAWAPSPKTKGADERVANGAGQPTATLIAVVDRCLLYTSDAADDM